MIYKNQSVFEINPYFSAEIILIPDLKNVVNPRNKGRGRKFNSVRFKRRKNRR